MAEELKAYLKSHQAALKGVSTLGHRVSISVRSEIFSGSVSPSELRLWTTTCAGFCGQATLERDLEPTGRRERSEPIGVSGKLVPAFRFGSDAQAPVAPLALILAEMLNW